VAKVHAPQQLGRATASGQVRESLPILSVSFSLTFASSLSACFVSGIVAILRERGKELMEDDLSREVRAEELIELNASLKERERELMEAKLSCEIRAQELAELNTRLKERERELMEANFSCELRAQELAELNDRLEELDKARSQFIYLVTHELRAPVAAIQSYLKLILEGYVPAEREREIISKAEQRALDQLALISDLLDLARLEQPRTEVEVERLDLADSLREVCDLMRAQAQEKGVSFCAQIDPKIPLVRANDEHIRQLWTNLISNAIKYTMSGGKVTITLTHDTDGVTGTVQDTGIGISPEDLPRVFDEFYRAENAKAMERHGTGLGLSIAKGIVDTYGGTMRAESEVGKGSTFAFTLPEAPGSTEPVNAGLRE
jgi:signal transduction histidine kinase